MSPVAVTVPMARLAVACVFTLFILTLTLPSASEVALNPLPAARVMISCAITCFALMFTAFSLGATSSVLPMSSSPAL